MVTSDESEAWIARNAPRLEDGYYNIATQLLRWLPVATGARALAA